MRGSGKGSPVSATSPVPESEEYEAEQVLKGHQDFVRSVAALNDVCIVSSSDDRAIKLWNSTDGQLLGTLEGHATWVACVIPLLPRTDADPDDPMAADRLVASGSFDTSIKIWNTRTGECLSTLEGHSDCARCLAVIPGQPRCLVSGGYDNTIKVWDYLDGVCIQTLEGGHTREVTCLCPLPSYGDLPQPRLISGSADASVKIWDVESGRCVQMLVGHKDYIRSVVALPPPPPAKWGWQEAAQGRVVSASGDMTLRVWCVQTGKPLHVLKGHSGPVQCVAALDDGARIVSGSFDKTLRVWDPASGRCLQVLNDHSHRVRSVAALPDGRFVSGADDMTVRVWRPAGMRVAVQKAEEMRDKGKEATARTPEAGAEAGTAGNPSPVQDTAEAAAGGAGPISATMRTTGALVNGLAMTRRGIETQFRQLQALLGGRAAEAEAATAADDLTREPDTEQQEVEPLQMQQEEEGQEEQPPQSGQSQEQQEVEPPQPLQMEEEEEEEEEGQQPSSRHSSGHKHHHHHHHHHHHSYSHSHQQRAEAAARREAARKEAEEEAMWRRLEDEAREKEAEVAALMEEEQRAKEARRKAREVRKKAQEEARLLVEEEGRAMHEVEARAKAKAAEAAVAAAQEAEEAEQRWKQERDARRQEETRKQQQQQQQQEEEEEGMQTAPSTATVRSAGLVEEEPVAAAAATGRIVQEEVEEEEEPTAELPVPLSPVGDALVGEGKKEGAAAAMGVDNPIRSGSSSSSSGDAAGSRWKALLAAVMVAALAIVALVALAAAQQQQQQPAPVVVVPATAPALSSVSPPVAPTTLTGSHNVHDDEEEAEVDEEEATDDEEEEDEDEEGGQVAGISWAEAAMAAAQAAVKAVTHRDPTRTPLYRAGGQVFAELAAAVHYDGMDEAEGPLAEMLLEAWEDGEEAAHREEWDVPRLSWALSDVRVSSVAPLRPKTRGAPSVNTGALKQREQAQQPAVVYDPAEEAAELVLERRLARMPKRRRPLAVRIVLAPFRLAVGILKLGPFRLAFSVLKAVTWPVRAILRR